MDGFLGNLLATLVGTFLGAGLALWAAHAQAKRTDTVRDRRLTQSVIDRLYRSRALRPKQVGGVRGTEWDREDRKRCTASVITTRERIAYVSDELSVGAKASIELGRMHVACLRYLSREEREPAQYVSALMVLREALAKEVNALCDRDKQLQRRIPGAGDLENPLELNRSI